MKIKVLYRFTIINNMVKDLKFIFFLIISFFNFEVLTYIISI